MLNLVERVRRQQVVIFEKGDLQKKCVAGFDKLSSTKWSPIK